MWRRSSWVGLVLALALVATACSSDEGSADGNSSGDGTDRSADEGSSSDDATGSSSDPDRDLSAIQAELERPGDDRQPVTFALDAPEADQVRLELTANYWNSRPQDTIVLDPTDDADGRHEVTLHLGDGQWLYRFRVDGRWVSDPENPRCVPAENGECNSVIDVGDSLPLFVADDSVNTGEIVRLELDSELLGTPQPVLIHLPPGYDPDVDYPLLVTLHGFGQGATEWFDVVGLPTALDNLYAAGRIEPMIVVAPEGGITFYRGQQGRHIVDEVIPYVEETYSVSTDRSLRAITGFSMGGNGALYLASQNPDEFGFAIPIAPGGFCTELVCGVESWEQEIGPAPDVAYSLFTGVTDELNLDENQAAISQVLTDRGIEHRAELVDFPGHRTDGHSVRFLRRLAPELLTGLQEDMFGPRPDPNGCPVDYPDWETSPYVLPYPVGASYPVDLDNCSSSFHGEGQPDAFAYDFDMDIGEVITAARGGEVIVAFGDDPDFGGSPGGNVVQIDHGDGTIGTYLHFTEDGVDVTEGDIVEQGDVIGRSGASGTNAAYPHLHFIVVKEPGSFPYQGVAVSFAGTEANPRGLESGMVYTNQGP